MFNGQLKGKVYSQGRRQREVAKACGLSEWQMTAIITGRLDASEGVKIRLANELDCAVLDIFPNEET